MPNHVSCKKRMRSSAKARLRNRTQKSSLRTILKTIRTETDAAKAAAMLPQVNKALDQAASKNLLHKRNADRTKSRLAALVARLAAPAPAAA